MFARKLTKSLFLLEMKPHHQTNLRKLLFSLTVVVYSHFLLAQPGKNGAFTVNAANTVVNCYTAVISNANLGATSIATDNACSFECGDLIMIYQAQGASVNTSNTASYGQVTNLNSAGLYEFNYVLSNALGVLSLQNPLANSYLANGKVQVIKVPQYTNLTINPNTSIVADPWQNSGSFKKGGIVAIHATGTINVNGTISANSAGFKAGNIENLTSQAGNAELTYYVVNDASLSAQKGESIAGAGVEYDALGGRFGKGAIANGGGGGNGHNCGGGGGSNGNNGVSYNGQGNMCTSCVGSSAWNLDPYVVATGSLSVSSGGGRGGYSYGNSNQNALVVGPNVSSWSGNRRNSNGGFGGYPLTNNAETRIFFGGGGGAGDANNNANQRGGNGGGIVYLIATNVTGVGSILANGENALNQISNGTAGWNDAPSGGGGGGSIVIKSATTNAIQISAVGGKGGDQGALSVESEGPGGGGGGGFVAVASGTPLISVAGGENGITLSASLTEFIANGATAGGSGNSVTTSLASIIYNPISVTATVNTPVCIGSSINFSTTVSPSGGTYQWTGPAGFASTLSNPSIASAMQLNAGNYTVIYTSQGGCTDTFQLAVNINPLPVFSISNSQMLCAQGCSGTATANVTSGQAPYVFTWNNGATTNSISNLCIGNYSLTVTDANLCSAVANTTISAPTQLSLTATNTATSCNGTCNGTVTLTASGGTGVLSYSMNGGPAQASAIFSSLCAGSYNFSVIDANGCSQTISSTINQPSLVSASIGQVTNATCGMSNGQVTILASGGTGTYVYTLGVITNGTGVFQNLSPGNHTVNIVDGSGCSTSIAFTIIAVAGPNATIQSLQNVVCANGNNGSVVISASGGVAPYQYAVGGGAYVNSNTFTNLIAGSYIVSVRDANNCLTTVNATITEPTAVNFTSISSPTLCLGQCNGQISVSASGGQAPYSYSMNAGTTYQSSSIIQNLCAGSYEIVVSDANGCLINSLQTVTEASGISLSVTSDNPSCNGLQDGEITVNATGGAGGYFYSLNNDPVQSSSIFSMVAAGLNTIVVTDANACEAEISATLVMPNPIVISQVSSIPSNCGFNNGTLVVGATGDFPSFLYSDNGSPFQSSGTFTNLLAGLHLIVVQDANGCQDSLYAGLNDIEMDGIFISSTDPLCYGGNDGTVEVQNVLGQLPITYELDGSGSTQSSGSFSGLEAGSHIVVIYDGGYCVFTLPFILNQPDPVTFTTQITNATCNSAANGEINFTSVAGGTTGGYAYSINNGATFSSSPNFSGLLAGTYNLVVRDINNCEGYNQVTISEPSSISIATNPSNLTCSNNNSGFILVDAFGSNGGFDFTLNGVSNGTSLFPNLSAGAYNLKATDQFGCSDSIEVVLTEPLPVDITGSSIDALCFGSCDGSISVSGTGGTGSYLFTQDFITMNTTGLFVNECSGLKMVYVEDQNGCQDSIQFLLSEPTAITLGVVVSPSTCSQSNGSVTINASGGTGTLEYSLDDGVTFTTSNSFTLVSSGIYNVVVEDVNECQTSTTATVIDLISPNITGITVENPSCHAMCDGSIVITSAGGTGLISYRINGVIQPTGTFTNLCAGTYTVEVVDINGCFDSETIVLTEPDPLVFDVSSFNLTCFENFSGSISMVNASGGTQPYYYSFDNGTSYGTSNVASNLASGNYTLILKDQNNCTFLQTTILTEPAFFTASVSITNPNCFGGCDGQAIVSTSGGTPGVITYTWNGVVSTDAINADLCAGNYNVDVMDVAGCNTNVLYTIEEAEIFEIDSVEWTTVTCNSLCDGAVSINAENATSFSFNNGPFQASNTQGGFCPGVVVVQAMNALGCIADGVALVNEPDVLQLFSNLDSLMCTNDTISLGAVAIGGTAPYNYSWSNGFNGPNQEVVQNVPELYEVTVVDANGCTASSATNLTMLPVLSFTFNNNVSVCAGDSATITVDITEGAPDYNFQWSTNPDDTLNSISVLPTTATSIFNLSVSDICLTIDTIVIVNQFSVPTPTFIIDYQEGCAPLQVLFETDATQVLENCTWSFSDGQTLIGCGPISAVFDQIGCWDATLTAETTDGCPVEMNYTSVVCVNGVPEADFTFNPTDPTPLENTVNFTNTSVGDSIVVWQIGDLMNTNIENPTYQFNDIDPGSSVEVCLTAIALGGCESVVCQTVTFGSDFLVWVPNTFTPDDDEHNDNFGPVFATDEYVDNYSFQIFNRWGEQIFNSMDRDVLWDGTYFGNVVQDGTFVWKLTYRDPKKGTMEEMVGHVNVIK